MAIDSAAKRASIPGVGRPWMRSISVDATKPAAWRQAVGNLYAGSPLAAAVAVVNSLVRSVSQSVVKAVTELK